jgi:hypothetical protein
MKKYLVKVDRNQPKPVISVLIQPCNENQEMNYIARFKGTAETIIVHSLNIIKGLKLTLPDGTFSVKVESPNLEDCIFIDENHVYDQNFEIIADINEAHLFLA